jgi:hypothetical protein
MEDKLRNSKIVVTEDFERRYWTSKFNCTNEELKLALRTVGNYEDNVMEFLSKLKNKVNNNHQNL